MKKIFLLILIFTLGCAPKKSSKVQTVEKPSPPKQQKPLPKPIAKKNAISLIFKNQTNYVFHAYISVDDPGSITPINHIQLDGAQTRKIDVDSTFHNVKKSYTTGEGKNSEYQPVRTLESSKRSQLNHLRIERPITQENWEFGLDHSKKGHKIIIEEASNGEIKVHFGDL